MCRTEVIGALNTLKKLLTPHYIILLTVLVSLSAWLLPFDNMRRGFLQKENLTVQAICFLLLWYGLIFVCGKVGFAVGRKIKRAETLDTIPDGTFYKIITALSLFGVLYVCITIVTTDPLFLQYILAFQANLLKNSLYDNYETGIHSLRYLSILGGAMALYYIVAEKSFKFIHLLNLVSLLVTSFLSSRLSIMLACLIFVGIMVRRGRRISVRTIAVFAILLFALLTVFNFYRNANYYKFFYNMTNPILMNISEMVTYLGSPFQVSVGVANHADEFRYNGNVEGRIAEKVFPTYVQSDEDEAVGHADAYRAFVDVEASLTTNSAFTSYYSGMGNYAFIVIAVISFLYAAIAGHISQYRSFLFVIQYVVLYCFAEVWRTDLFTAGIIHILILAMVCIAFIGMPFKRTVRISTSKVDAAHANY